MIGAQQVSGQNFKGELCRVTPTSCLQCFLTMRVRPENGQIFSTPFNLIIKLILSNVILFSIGPIRFRLSWNFLPCSLQSARFALCL